MTETPNKSATPDLATRVLALGQRVKTIREISQSSGSFRFDLTRLRQPNSEPLQIRFFEGPCRFGVEGHVLRVELDFGVTASNGGVDEAPTIEASATFAIHYSIAEDADTAPEVLAAFGQVNGKFNLTAYWREFLQACSARAGLPPLIVPPFNATRSIRALKSHDQGPVKE